MVVELVVVVPTGKSMMMSLPPVGPEPVVTIVVMAPMMASIVPQ